MDYNFIEIEKKWQKHWKDNKSFKVYEYTNKPKYYCLDMFPYPSANGLHVGHVEGYTATDIITRFKIMQGYNVLSPMGFDAFGLPAEQYALRTGNHPKDFTIKNTLNFKDQLNRLGKVIDWDKSFLTSDSNYFKWTQWIFKKLYENNLAVLKDVEVNFCPELGTVLANDEIIIKDGKMVSERGEYLVEKKAMKQWVLKITKYADRLLKDLDLVDWPENIKEAQRNWIGKSEGALIDFKVEESNEKITVYTTRPDTVFGISYLVLAPEHSLVLKLTKEEEKETVLAYIEQTKQKSDLDRETQKTKTGVFTGSFAKSPFDNKLLPIWVADYVFYKYGTGAVMAVPAHDTRDYEFALKYGLSINKIIDVDDSLLPYTEDGLHINSSFINGKNIEEAKQDIINYLEQKNIGKKETKYKLRDWVFSRQRYWGEPFPVLYDKNGEIKLIPDKFLPLELPNLSNFKPEGSGKSPLANAHDWVNVKINGIEYERDTNTMPQVAGSSWYFLAYILQNEKELIDLNSKKAKELLDKWMPVDFYLGGKEHTVGHLLYARFWHKFLYDLGLVSTPEPFQKYYYPGMILKDGHKMSKSKGNVVIPDEIYKSHGADALRLYVMFMGPLNMDKDWQTTMLDGAKRFIDRVVRMFEYLTNEQTLELNEVLHQTIKKVTYDFENISINTSISQLMIFVNEVYKLKKISYEHAYIFLQLLNPICPHITEEINKEILKNENELFSSTWPKYEEKYLEKKEIEIVVQVNGKIRAKKLIDVDLEEAKIKEIALNDENVLKFTNNLEIIKVIYVKNKLVSIVAK